MTAALTALGAAPAVPASPHGDDLSPDIRALMAKPGFEHAQWGLLELDDRGRVVHSRYPDQFFVPGSTAKLVSVSGAWHTLGSDHRFTTPVQASAAATARC